MKMSQRAYDDLTAVRGIGPARQQWLRESFNVRAYADLAALSVDQIAARLKADGQITSRSAIAAWLLKAQELAAKADGSSQRTSRGNLHPASETADKKNNPAAGDGDWKSVDTFIVDFQVRQVKGKPEQFRTKVHHMQETGDEENWPGILGTEESQQLWRWILEHAGEKVQQESGKRGPVRAGPAEAPPTGRAPAQVRITQVRVFQPSRAETSLGIIEAGKQFPGSLRGDEPFEFEVAFELVGESAAEIAKSAIGYEVRSYAYRQSTQAPTVQLGDARVDALVEGKLEYATRLPAATLQAGEYRLWVAVTLPSTSVLPDFLDAPLLQVA